MRHPTLRWMRRFTKRLLLQMSKHSCGARVRRDERVRLGSRRDWERDESVRGRDEVAVRKSLVAQRDFANAIFNRAREAGPSRHERVKLAALAAGVHARRQLVE